MINLVCMTDTLTPEREKDIDLLPHNSLGSDLFLDNVSSGWRRGSNKNRSMCYIITECLQVMCQL